jgi:hypothetical protein
MLIALVNESSLVTNDQCQTMAEAVQFQVTNHVLPAWNMKECTVSFFADKTKVPVDAWVVSMLDSATTAGALGYHSEDNDKVDGFIFAEPVLSNGGAVMVFDPKNPGQYTVSATFSHETLEIIGDYFINTFILGTQIQQGNLYAAELCDCVEGDSYSCTINGIEIALSNFILPEWYNPQAVAKDGPFDYLKKLTAPFTMDAGGYMIVASMSNEGQVEAKQIFGDKIPQWRQDHINSEWARR